MKSSLTGILPLLRSDTQGRMLAELYLHPDAEHSLKELASKIGVSSPTILRDVDRLVNSGFLKDRKQGRSRLIRANIDHPVYRQLTDIVLYGYGPMAVLPEILDKITGVDEAWIFGSWAARYQGQPVKDVGDLDVLVLGTPTRMDLHNAASNASSLLRMEVSFHPVPWAVWEDRSNPFVSSIRNGARIQIDLTAAS